MRRSVEFGLQAAVALTLLAGCGRSSAPAFGEQPTQPAAAPTATLPENTGSYSRAVAERVRKVCGGDVFLGRFTSTSNPVRMEPNPESEQLWVKGEGGVDTKDITRRDVLATKAAPFWYCTTQDVFQAGTLPKLRVGSDTGATVKPDEPIYFHDNGLAK